MYLSGVERQKLLLSTLSSLSVSLALYLCQLYSTCLGEIDAIQFEHRQRESGYMNGRRQGHTGEQEEHRTQGEAL